MPEKAFNEIFSKRLRHYMEEYELTQVDLAKRLGVGTTSVYNWYNGIKTPRMDKVDAMCKIFHCKRSDLMEEKSERDVELSDDRRALLSKYDELNSVGRSKLHDRADELIQLGYTHEDPELIAAHDEGATPEEREAALKLMRDDSKW